MPRRIGVIECDEIERIGRVAALQASGFAVAAAASPDDAFQWTDAHWRQFDLVLLGVAADQQRWDRFECISLARRAQATNPNARLVAVCGPRVLPLVKLRLLQAGVHRIWSMQLARTVEEIARLAHPAPHDGDRPPRLRCDVRGAIVGARTDPQAVLDFVINGKLQAAFEANDRQADTGLSRRQIIGLRRDISRLGDLSVPSGFATGGPAVDRSLPSWRSVVRYVNRARGFDEDAFSDAPSILYDVSLSA